MSVREEAGDSSGRNGRRRRRHWSSTEKRRIVAEADAPGASVSVVARRYDLNANMLFTWRRELAADVGPATEVAPAFVPAAISAPDLPAADAVCTAAGRIEIVLADGNRIIAGSDVDTAALARVVRGLSRR